MSSSRRLNGTGRTCGTRRRGARCRPARGMVGAGGEQPGTIAWLHESGVADRRVAVQLHGSPLPEYTGPLLDAGARLVEVQPYRWLPPAEPELVHRLVDG